MNEEKSQEYLDTREAGIASGVANERTINIIELASDLSRAMIHCTCAAHQQLAHLECVMGPVVDEVAGIAINLLGDMESENNVNVYFKLVVQRTRDVTVKHLEAHIPNFSSQA